ncbi:valine--tRNA ligase [Membranicola marinus]|uniref:Valine--tRNA ligase n=1 Tax=Membranihabitans marinus TaxID=1227546 RepID=A0A953HXE7_9BACT|nr:valine--tRNA ligase [Membranihabitans marinus]MBY5958396.1 valine--tRNA ligase [Membranihabitans marinus]
MPNLSKHYTSGTVEKKWYDTWEEHKIFESRPDDREPYSIVIPPPNVTGVLHMGHMLNNSIQDILIRKARLDGKNACWVPGTDHASIATEAKVVNWLREQGIKKGDLSRDKFMEYAWEWTDKYGGIILKQLKKLGASCDWSRTAFTMDEVRSGQVIQAFVDLYQKDKLYRGLRMVNWDPEAQTVLSNEEVIHSEENSLLYHVRYPVEGTDEHLIIATTRPETILADTGVAIHPDDERYHHLKNMKVRIPIADRIVPVISDDYVEMEFGTGALKITPAHDVNDYEIGQRHELEVIDIFEDDATINDLGLHYKGLDRFEARKKIVKELEEKGFLVKTEDYSNSVGRSERTGAVVEPKLSLQWYVDMKSLAAPALDAVMTDEVRFFPSNMKNTYKHWMSNIRDWCISRQLWWGHRIPAWYYEDQIFVATTAEEALEQAQKAFPDQNLTASDLRQDEDVLDTWFSSWLWPFSVFDGMDGGDEVDYYYPTATLVTGWDIIFLWVARMVMAGYEWKGEKPFQQVYFTGMVRDKQRRKMSKSLGNSPDALELIEKFGADGVRFGLLSSSPAGGDLLFEEKLCEQGRNFCNKMWNGLRLIKGWTISSSTNSTSDKETIIREIALTWFEDKLKEQEDLIQKDFDEYRLSEAVMKLYNFIWNDFFSWLLEVVKPPYGDAIDQASYDRIIQIYENLMKLLHPFMPFVTEEIYQQLRLRKEGDFIATSSWPEGGECDTSMFDTMESIKALVTQIRDLRNKHQLKQKEPLDLYFAKSESTTNLLRQSGMKEILIKMAALGKVEQTTEAPKDLHASIVQGRIKAYLMLPGVDVEEERQKLEEELDYARGFVKKIESKLANERFVQNAPEAIVAKERKKLEDGKGRVAMLEESLEQLL